MNTNKKILHDAVDSLKADDATSFKKHIKHAILLKIRQSVKNKKKELAKHIFKGINI